MERHGVNFAKEMVPSKFEKTADGKVKVFVKDAEYGVFDTVLMAVGRTGCAGQLNLEAAGLSYNAKSGKVDVNDTDQTSVPHIFAVGDVIEGKPELTPWRFRLGSSFAGAFSRELQRRWTTPMLPPQSSRPLNMDALDIQRRMQWRSLERTRSRCTIAPHSRWNRTSIQSERRIWVTWSWLWTRRPKKRWWESISWGPTPEKSFRALLWPSVVGSQRSTSMIALASIQPTQSHTLLWQKRRQKALPFLPREAADLKEALPLHEIVYQRAGDWWGTCLWALVMSCASVQLWVGSV